MWVIEGTLKGRVSQHHPRGRRNQNRSPLRGIKWANESVTNPGKHLAWTGYGQHKPFVGSIVGLNRAVVWVESPARKGGTVVPTLGTVRFCGGGRSKHWWIVTSVATDGRGSCGGGRMLLPNS